jgi:hypothetical protein
MASDASASPCLNCGENLTGPFCSRCGQRAIPAYPTLGELLGDAWSELSGYDGRVVRTFRSLVRRPGALTLEVLEGHRARYVSPVRVYLVASVIYFLLAAASPNVIQPPAPALPRSNVTIDLRDPEATARLSPEKRQELLANVERAPWWLRPTLRSALGNPAEFRHRILQNLPRTLFALVPVFAAIVALFYRRRPFSQHLIFALHLHAVVFLAQALRELADFTYSRVAVTLVSVAALMFTAVYALRAFKAVYGEPWRWVVVKSGGVAALYGIACLAGLIVTLAWASLT